MAADTPASAPARHRPRSATVFVAAFVAGAAAAVGVNRALDVHLAQSKPQVECEPIFVALRSLPQGTPITVWDVALRDWPKAMLPASALRVNDSFEGCLLKYPLREGQPLLAAQLLKAAAVTPAAVTPAPAAIEEDLIEEAFVPPPPAEKPRPSPTTAVIEDRVSEQTSTTETRAEPIASTPALPTPPAAATTEAVVEAVEQPATDASASVVQDAPPQPVVPEPSRSSETVAEAARPAAVEPSQPTLAGEPTLAATSGGEELPEATTVATAPASGADDSVSDDVDSAFDVPSRPAVDLSSIPSVMSDSSTAAAPAEDEAGSGPNVRYLVVPERIARQADTSFTTPVAPEGRPVAAAQANTPTPTMAAQANAQPQAAAQPAQPQRAASARGNSRQPEARQGQRPQQAKPQQSRGQTQQPRSQTQQKTAAPESEQTSVRAWGGMFPNVSAGLDAIGSWRGRVREAGVPQRPASDAAPQRR